MFLHEDIRMGSDQGHRGCRAEIYTLYPLMYCMYKAFLLTPEVHVRESDGRTLESTYAFECRNKFVFEI